jgi:hypothetical protein
VSEFEKWLDAEINDLARYKENNMIWGKHTEAVRIREMYRQCEEVQSTLDRDKLIRAKDEICKKYCVFQQAYDDKERMAKEHCVFCSLNELVK